jgi:hypothetical protein
MNPLEALVLLSVVLSVASKILPRLDAIFVWILGILLALLAGFRAGGFDYEQYLIIIEHVRSLHGSDFVIRSVAAKDPAFLLIIEIVSKLTLDPQFVFLAVAVLSVLPKILVSAFFPRNRTFFLSLYAVFLAPGLEFAAIRAGMGTGFLMLGLVATSQAQKVLLFGAAIVSHASLIVSVTAHIIGRNRLLTVVAIFFVPLVPVTLEIFSSRFTRLEQFTDNQGTLFALALPLLSFFSTLSFALISHRQRAINDENFLILRRACLLSVSLSVVLAIPMVTVSFRLLEISWILLLMLLLGARLTLLSRTQIIFVCGSWFLWIFCVVASNVLRSTWYGVALEQL